MKRSSSTPTATQGLGSRINVAAFWLVQASALLVLVVPFSWGLVGLAVLSYVARMLGITLGFHRYVAHGAFRSSRVLGFLWTLLGTAAMQKGPLWWAGNHVYHHRDADGPTDPHSPRRGFYHAHQGWFLDSVRWDRVAADNPVVRRFADRPEIVLLDRWFFVPPIALAAGLYAVGGLPWLAWGFCLPTVALAHATFSINSITHMYGTRRFDTPDDSRNNALTALLTLGEGWHNNHHRFPPAARNGFYWWELDPTWWVIAGMERLGLVWDVRRVPTRVYAEAGAGAGMPPGRPRKAGMQPPAEGIAA